MDCHNGRDASVKLPVYCIIGSFDRLNRRNAWGSGSEGTPASFWKMSCLLTDRSAICFPFLPGETWIHTGLTFNGQWVGKKLHRPSSSFYRLGRLASYHLELLWNCESYVRLDSGSARPEAAICTVQQTQKELKTYIHAWNGRRRFMLRTPLPHYIQLILFFTYKRCQFSDYERRLLNDWQTWFEKDAEGSGHYMI